jgi:plasmid stabilization system protein ParE
MSRPILIRPEAEAEMADAFNWHEDRVAGLGCEFLMAIDACLQRITRNPDQHPLVHKTVRRALLRRFPYGIFFISEPERIVVLAVFHAKRNPRRWLERTCLRGRSWVAANGRAGF